MSQVFPTRLSSDLPGGGKCLSVGAEYLEPLPGLAVAPVPALGRVGFHERPVDGQVLGKRIGRQPARELVGICLDGLRQALDAGWVIALAELYLAPGDGGRVGRRSEEHTSELQSLMRISYAVFCL